MSLFLMLGLIADGNAGDLRVGSAALARSPDPHYGTSSGDRLLHAQLYEGLVDTDGYRTIRGALAESWQWTGDGWLFRLNSAVRFQNGRPLTARDVIYSFCRAATMSHGPRPYGKPLREMRSAEERGVDAVFIRMPPGDVQFPLEVATVPIIAAPNGQPLPAFGTDACKRIPPAPVSGFTNPAQGVGTGPYALSRFGPDQIILIPNPQYRGGRAEWDRVELLLIKGNERPRAIVGGRIDILYAPPRSAMGFVQTRDDLRVITTASSSILYLQFNFKSNGPVRISDVRVRKAIRMALPTALLGDRVKSDIGEATGQLAMPGMPERSPTIPNEDFNPVAARQLLTEAGYPSGISLRLLTNSVHTRLARAIAHFMADAGIKVEILSLDSENTSVTRRSSDYDIYCVGWVYNAADLGGSLHKLLGASTTGRAVGERNYGGHVDPILDQLLARARSEPDDRTEAELLRSASERAFQQVAWVPLMHTRAAWALRVGLDMPQRMDRSLRINEVTSTVTANVR